MEKVKEILLSAGKTALNSAVELGRSVVQLAARLGGTAASFVGKKTCALAKEHRQPLLLAAAAVSGVLAIGSLILWLTGRRDAVRLPAADRKEESIYGKKGIQGGVSAAAGPDDPLHLHPQGDLPA